MAQSDPRVGRLEVIQVRLPEALLAAAELALPAMHLLHVAPHGSCRVTLDWN